MKKKIVFFSSIATTILATVTAISGILLTNRLMYIKPKDPTFVYERETKARRFDEVWYNECPKQELSISSPNGYTIKGIFLKPLETTNTIIICHGVTENKINSVKYARMFERLGFNMVVYDHRRHGDSGGKTTSYGYYEKFDLGAVVQEIRSIIGEDALLGIHGESMGAATTLLYAGTVNDGGNFYISDCAFSDFRELLYLIIKHTISFNFRAAVPISDLFMRLRDGYSLRSVTPKEVVQHIKKPVLFIHSIPDEFIPYEMAEDLFKLKPDPKMLLLFDKGGHAQSFNESPEQYELLVKEFLYQFVPNSGGFMDDGEEPAS
ncbi:alpha/beta hydrolase [Solibacillus sp. FSL H8-0538]|uniref:alpha/beta hydrolase n=1 Tax=Solibacillus sp. FSL H8-0538 TaxID=2921400 RepID=UPI0030F59158